MCCLRLQMRRRRCVRALHKLSVSQLNFEHSIARRLNWTILPGWVASYIAIACFDMYATCCTRPRDTIMQRRRQKRRENCGWWWIDAVKWLFPDDPAAASVLGASAVPRFFNAAVYYIISFVSIYCRFIFAVASFLDLTLKFFTPSHRMFEHLHKILNIG